MKITVLRTLAGNDAHCPAGSSTCPAVIAIDQHPERRYVITKKETDPAVLAALDPYLAEDEQVGWAAAELLAEIGPEIRP